MAALVDEIILHSAWDGSIEWLGQPLQLYFFSEHLAGEGFFTRLDILRQNALNNCDLLEVYYVCLELGFTGIYRIKGREFLQGLQVGLYQQIVSARSQQNNNVNSSQLLTKNGEKIHFHELLLSTIGLITIFILVVVYLSFLWSIDRKTDLAVRQIDHNLMV
jgi:type VI secretion system protein ImpK